MKLIYLGETIYNNQFKSLYKSLGIETIHYKNPLKAVDNLVEIEPDIFYIVKDDFPRLWKIVLSGVRELFSDKKALFILEGSLNGDELKAFNYLNGSLVITNSNDSLLKMKNVIINSFDLHEYNNMFFPLENEMGLGFLKPDDYSFISGHIVEIKNNYITFKPESLEDISSLPLDSHIKEASISLGDSVINLDLQLIKSDKNLVFKVINESEEYKTFKQSLFV